MILIKLAIFICAELGFLSANPAPVLSHELVRHQEKYPFVAALRQNEKFVCSGAIIAPNAVVTSASCAQQLNPENGEPLMVTAGLTVADAECFAKFPNLQAVKVKNIITHPGYSKCTEDNNDIAVVILDGELSINEYVRPIKLIEGTRSCMSGKPVDIVGWGINKCEGKVNDMAVIVATLQTEAECKEALLPLQKYETIGCAEMGVQSDMWHGPGSPVIIFNSCNPDNHMLVGITVNPLKQTKFRNPFVFTEIQNVNEFIKSTL